MPSSHLHSSAAELQASVSESVKQALHQQKAARQAPHASHVPATDRPRLHNPAVQHACPQALPTGSSTCSTRLRETFQPQDSRPQPLSVPSADRTAAEDAQSAKAKAEAGMLGTQDNQEHRQPCSAPNTSSDATTPSCDVLCSDTIRLTSDTICLPSSSAADPLHALTATEAPMADPQQRTDQHPSTLPFSAVDLSHVGSTAASDSTQHRLHQQESTAGVAADPRPQLWQVKAVCSDVMYSVVHFAQQCCMAALRHGKAAQTQGFLAYRLASHRLCLAQLTDNVMSAVQHGES